MYILHSIHRALGTRRLLLIALACVIGLSSLGLSSIAAQPTLPAQPTQPPQPTQPSQPTQPPQPTQPSQPTQPPQPTQSPPPTAAPTSPPTVPSTAPPTSPPTVPPTAPPTVPPTIPPTAQPTEAPTVVPTEAPAATATTPPTVAPPPSPTIAPTSPPRPQPTQPAQQIQPATPQTAAEAQIDCEEFAAAAVASPVAAQAGDGWILYACEVELDFGPVASLAVRGETGTPGWRVILVDEDAPNTPGLLDASNNRLEIDGLEGERTATFLLGVNPSCTAFKAATVDVEITGDRPGADGATVETTGSVPLTLPSERPPAVTLESLSVAGDRATLDIGYEGAPAECGWQLLVTLGVADPGAIAIDTITGPDGTAGAAADGVISILVPAAGDDSATGTIGVRLQLTEDASIETVLIEAITFP